MLYVQVMKYALPYARFEKLITLVSAEDQLILWSYALKIQLIKKKVTTTQAKDHSKWRKIDFDSAKF